MTHPAQDTESADSDEGKATPGASRRVLFPVSRWTGAWRAAACFSLGGLLVIPLIQRWPTLRFVPTAFSNRIADYSWAILLIAVAAGGLLIALNGCRWLLFALWPTNHGVEADPETLHIRLGPIGTKHLRWDDMTIQYGFESDPAVEDAAYDEFLEPEEELATRLPRITHPGSGNAQVNLILERFTTLPEAELARQLRGFLLEARQRQNKPVVLPDEEV